MASIQWGAAAAAAVCALLLAVPLRAADSSGVRTVAEELGQRTKPAAVPESEQKGGLSDSAVRVLMTYAMSIIPDSYAGSDGKDVKIDKSDPSKFVIPVEDARRVVRAATRSAYAEVCDLKDLARANFDTLMKSEETKKWSKDQMLLISALHMFSVSYFTGSIKITTQEVPDKAAGNPPANGAAPVSVSKNGEPAQPTATDPSPETEVLAPKRPTCPPEQKVKVTNAINAYVAANAGPQATKPPAATANGGAN
ncbi:MAG: hypothetical protein ACM3MH_00215 [Actinomycetota bacterium]